MADTETPARENVAQTMRKAMEEIGRTEQMPNPIGGIDFTQPHLASMPQARKLVDLTSYYLEAAQYLKPARRRGTARLSDLSSLIGWTKRFKGENSALFANPEMADPTLTAISDYHVAGAPDATDPTGDPTARHCGHRAVYNFPLSKEWKAWMGISGKALEKDDMGEFIEANAKDVLDPTPALIALKDSDKNADWENRLIQTAQKIEGRFGQLHELLAMSRQFAVHESSNLTVKMNRDTGEQEVQFVNEHKSPEGKPLKIPNLIIIAIPVFLNGAPYRMAVRFRYRKMGGSVRFLLSIYNPERSFEDAFYEAVNEAQQETKLPLFMGKPES